MEIDGMTNRIRKQNKNDRKTLSREESADCSESGAAPGVSIPPEREKPGGLKNNELQLRISKAAGADCISQTGRHFPTTPPSPPPAQPLFEATIPVCLEYFHASGIEVLSDDIMFLKKLLPRATVNRNSVIRSYIEIWRAAYHGESVQHRQANKARFAANQWLRKEAARKKEKVIRYD